MTQAGLPRHIAAVRIKKNAKNKQRNITTPSDPDFCVCGAVTVVAPCGHPQQRVALVPQDTRLCLRTLSHPC